MDRTRHEAGSARAQASRRSRTTTYNKRERLAQPYVQSGRRRALPCIFNWLVPRGS